MDRFKCYVASLNSPKLSNLKLKYEMQTVGHSPEVLKSYHFFHNDFSLKASIPPCGGIILNSWGLQQHHTGFISSCYSVQ